MHNMVMDSNMESFQRLEVTVSLLCEKMPCAE